MWVEILVKNFKSLLVCIIYRPPDSSEYLDRNFEEKFDDMITTTMVEKKETIIGGDMNCHYLDQLNHLKQAETTTQFTRLPIPLTCQVSLPYILNFTMSKLVTW